jgi:2-dehydro-3-deoxy-D-arabinonate dehydratase
MQICRFHLPDRGARLGQIVAGDVCDLTASGQPALATLSAFLQASAVTSAQALLHAVGIRDLPIYAYADLDRPPDPNAPHLLAPVDQQEIWAAGVTYAWSREARVREAQTKEVYVRVYEAARPELFFKCLAHKAVGPNDWIGLRGDSIWNVPEPELTLVLNPAMEIVGYTIGNDVSSRDIEGENPLYLPQAKIYRHACALGPAITVVDSSAELQDLVVRLTVNRDGGIVFQGETSTAKMRRTFRQLVSYLSRYNDFPFGALLLTGTGIVPGDDFSLWDGDDVLIEIDGIGSLRNPVRQM